MGNLVNLPNITVESLVINDNIQQKPIEKQSAFNEKNYLNVRLNEEKGETKREVRIRLLPFIFGDKVEPCAHVHIHSASVAPEISKSKFKSYFCLSKTEGINHEPDGSVKKCPFCEISDNANKMQWSETDPDKKEKLKKTWMAYSAKPGVILRCIERGKESEGVKFWKFNLRQDKTDPYSQIKALAQTRKEEGLQAGRNIDIFDYNEGYDIILTITKGGDKKKGNGITVTDAKFPSPLSNDPEQIKSWIYDTKKWTDVFGVKDYNYLSLIADGKIPFYDKSTGTWVAKIEKMEEQAANVAQADANIAEAQAQFVNAVPVVEEVVPDPNAFMVNNDDLPF